MVLDTRPVLSEQDIRRIASLALRPFDDGWVPGIRRGAANGGEAEWLATWERAVTRRTGPGGFEQRLAGLGLDRESALSWLCPRELDPASPLPAWAAAVQEAYLHHAQGPGVLAECLSAWLPGERSAYKLDEDRLPLFPDWLYPFIALVLERMRAVLDTTTVPDTAVRGTLARAVLVRLSALSCRVIARLIESQTGDPATPPTADLCALQAFPALLRLLGEACLACVETFTELLQRADRDRQALTDFFNEGVDPGPVAGVLAWRSDPHGGNRSVCFLHFSSGLELVYKPRSHAIDIAFTEFLAKLVEAGGPALRLPRTLARDAYGWSEKIASLDCTDAAAVGRYRMRQGAITALTHLLSGLDFHYENFIACGEWPVPIDVEALLSLADQPPPPEVRKLPAYMHWVATASCLGTAMGSGWRIGRGDQALFVSSGIGGCKSRLWPEKVPRWAGSPERPVLRWRLDRVGYLRNLPTIGSVPQHLDLAAVEDVAQGFRQAYRSIQRRATAIISSGGDLDAYSACPTRMLLRDTAEYASLLFHSLAPEHLRCGHDYALSLQGLSGQLPQFRNLPAEDVVAEDHRACLNQDIPAWYASAGGTMVRSPGGRLFGPVAPTSALEEARRRIERTCDEDCESQAQILRASLLTAIQDQTDAATVAPPSTRALEALGWGLFFAEHRQAPTADADRDAVQAFACGVGDALDRLALRLDDGLAWLGLMRPDGVSAMVVPYLAPPWSLKGAAGAALLFANLHHALGGERYAALARGALRMVLRARGRLRTESWWNRVEVSAYAGLAGPVYVLAESARLLKDERLLDQALECALDLSPERLAQETNPDWLGGVAGTTASLLHLDSLRPDPRLRASATAALGVMQRAAAASPEPGGFSVPGFARPMLGMGHGAAGVAAACSLLAARTGNEEAGRLAEQAYRWEREHFDTLAGDWPDRRQDGAQPAFASGWCAGPAGAALARSVSQRARPDTRLEDEARLAIDKCRQRMGADRHHLCCGESGRIFALLDAAEGREGLRRGALAAAAATARHQKSRGFVYQHELAEAAWTPGILDGAAGMALAALATLHEGCSNPLSLGCLP